MKPRVYVETSVVSYLTARLSRDIVVLGNQVVTREWWASVADRFEPVASELVLEEASEGDPRAAAERLAVLESMHLLDVITRPGRSAGPFPSARACDAKQGDSGRCTYRGGRGARRGFLGNMELPPYREPNESVADRAGVSRRRLRSDHNLHTQATHGGMTIE